MEEGRKYAYWLLNNNILDVEQKNRLIDIFKDAYHIYFASGKELEETGVINSKKADELEKQKALYKLDEEYMSFLQEPFSFTTIEDDDYPLMLRHIANAPYGLFYLGQLPDINEKCIAMVGSRNCSAYGKKCAYELANYLAKNGFTIVSGMARGVDSFSHRGCLDGSGRTIAVLGCGVDVIYPKENYKLYEEIAKNGCIMSEFPMNRQPLSIQFPRRNRIISGLSKGVIVVEAREKSGSLITADFALEQGRDIYAVPGRIFDTCSSGCNRLINEGAGIIYSYESLARDFLEGQEKELKQITFDDGKKIILENDEATMYKFVDYYPKNVAQLQVESGFDYVYTLELLMKLVMKKMVIEVYVNTYIRV